MCRVVQGTTVAPKRQQRLATLPTLCGAYSAGRRLMPTRAMVARSEGLLWPSPCRLAWEHRDIDSAHPKPTATADSPLNLESVCVCVCVGASSHITIHNVRFTGSQAGVHAAGLLLHAPTLHPPTRVHRVKAVGPLVSLVS